MCVFVFLHYVMGEVKIYINVIISVDTIHVMSRDKLAELVS